MKQKTCVYILDKLATEITIGHLSSYTIVINIQFDTKIDELRANRVPDADNWAVNKFNSWLQSSTFSAEFSDFNQIPVTRLNHILEFIFRTN